MTSAVPGDGRGSVQESLWPDAAGRGGPLIARDALDPLSQDVLEAIPARGAGPATIAVAAGVGVDAVVRSIGLLAAGGYVERCSRGWRIRRRAASFPGPAGRAPW